MKRIYFFLSFMLLVLHMEGQVWRDVSGGINRQPGHSVNDMIFFEDSLFIVGEFDSLYSPLQYCSGFAVLDSTNYQCRSGTQLFQSSLCIGTYQNELVIGSRGSPTFQPQFSRIRRISGGVVYPFGNGIQNGEVRCLQEYNGELYVGGNFTTVDSTINAKRIARWDGSQWHAIGIGANGGFITGIRAMTIFNGELIVGGMFGSIDGFPANSVCSFNSTQWDSLGSGVFGQIQCFVIDSINNFLYAGGQIWSAGGIPTPCGIAKWDGSSWSAVGSEPILNPIDMVMYKGKLFAGGVQTGLNSLGQTVFQMAWYDGQNWIPACDTMDGGEIESMCVYKDELYVGGYFKMIDDSALYGIARTHFPNVSVLDYDAGTSTVKVYPNPTNAILNIQSNSLSGLTGTLRLISHTGQELYSTNLKGAMKLSIPTTKFSSGLYLIIFESEGKRWSRRVIIE